MKRVDFLRTMAVALLGGFVGLRPPELERIPEPVERVCERCGGKGEIVVDAAYPHGTAVRAEGGYLPEPRAARYESHPCPACTGVVARTRDGDAFYAYGRNYPEILTKRPDGSVIREVKAELPWPRDA